MATKPKSPLTNPTGYDPYGLLGGTNVYTKYDNVDKTNTSKVGAGFIGPMPTPQLQSFGSSGGSGGSGYSISGILSAYDQSAAADRALAQQVYDTTVRNLNTALDRARDSYNVGVTNANNAYNLTANNLKRALERYQESNKKSVENQKRAYLSDQASLEDARFQTDRQTRIDAAARGLGGSGLQQLAQLQNLISQGNDISKLAMSNQSVMDDLRTALQQYTEDNEAQLSQAQQTRDTSLANLLTTLNYAEQDNLTGLQDALTTYQNSINKINADLASSKASARSSYSSGSSSNSTLLGYLDQIQEDSIADIKSIANASDKEFKKIAKAYYGDSYSKSITKEKMLNDYVSDSLSSALNQGANQSQRNTLKSNLSSYLNYYGY